MKRIISSLLLATGILLVSNVYGQASEKGNFVLTPSLNLGGHSFVGGYGYYGSGGFPIGATLNADFSVHAYASVGPYIAYNYHNNSGWTNNTMAFGARGNFHFWQLIDDKVAKDLKADKIDWFYSLSLGGYIDRWNDKGSDYDGTDGGFALGSSLGFRYYFNDHVGISFEYGWCELSWAKIGVPIKF